jgi:hypothetical protein
MDSEMGLVEILVCIKHNIGCFTAETVDKHIKRACILWCDDRCELQSSAGRPLWRN